MTRDDIIRMAREAGLSVGTNISGVVLVGSPAEIGLNHLTIDELERFAAVVAAAERERCALLCEEVARLESEQWALDGACAAHECAQRIREAV